MVAMFFKARKHCFDKNAQLDSSHDSQRIKKLLLKYNHKLCQGSMLKVKLENFLLLPKLTEQANQQTFL